MDAFFLIDKPIWLTSFDVLRKLKKILNLKKMGHTWTLDPLATGLLLVAIWNYTKLIPYFEKDTKEYEFKIALNGTTPSFDSETEITFLSAEKQAYFSNNLKQESIQILLNKHFSWEITQVPPKYSALKIAGQKALDMVRSGQEFEMKARKTTIFEIEILSYNYPEIHLKAKVSAGTYIRSIAHDLWQLLGTWWYITFLRRTQIGRLDMQFAQSLDIFDAQKKLPEKYLFDEKKFISLDENTLNELSHGRIVPNIWEKYISWEEYFVTDGEKVTYIVKINGLDMQSVRKI